jgi:hypothetical protein
MPEFRQAHQERQCRAPQTHHPIPSLTIQSVFQAFKAAVHAGSQGDQTFLNGVQLGIESLQPELEAVKGVAEFAIGHQGDPP